MTVRGEYREPCEHTGSQMHMGLCRTSGSTLCTGTALWRAQEAKKLQDRLQGIPEPKSLAAGLGLEPRTY